MAFKDDFIWGAAAASYQIEGSTQFVDGCAESVWDMCSRKKGFVQGGNNGFVACDHYNRYKEDVAIMSEMSLQAYRLSIMWPRVKPQGIGKVNAQGLDYYDRLIDELLSKGIDPWVTLFHWDYPIALFHKGGWLNDDSSDWFAEYTRVIVEKLSDRVSNWFTLNEQACFIGHGHQTGMHAPGLQLANKEVNRAWHNALLAHGKAVKIIREEAKSPAKVGAAPCFRTAVPFSHSAEDIEAARQHTFSMLDDSMFNATWWMDPAFKGEYPEDGLLLFADDSPVIKEGDMDIICQPLDFVGFNVYSSALVRAGLDGKPEVVEYPSDHPMSYFKWPVSPESLRWGTQFLYERYQKPIIVTENGLSLNDWVSLDGKVHDPKRIDFLNRYLLGAKQAIENGTDIIGYFQWSILDNFEWAEGYGQRFGMVHVDYASQKRTVKDSGYWYKEVIESKGKKLGEHSPLHEWVRPENFNKNIK
ncbi:GH1 family beta-glucosidase [Psychromonas antarctica]|jgi:beta-glucosidase|uniref:GH1 family beta-glucosidase n=1 Tax=Psychromonas antarctica TaxID=67573 RepID=UPI001EE8DA0E|nr:GH1 family beta-glucosidase [Psychromonas antarctica]MCG6201108.1 GH1 family beta-glucosidase [Psychromonas antarctica]